MCSATTKERNRILAIIETKKEDEQRDEPERWEYIQHYAIADVLNELIEQIEGNNDG